MIGLQRVIIMRITDKTDFVSSTEFEWEDNSFVYLRKLGPKTIEICANIPGLHSLAKQIILLADSDLPHIFYDTDPGDLEEGSLYMQITKVNAKGRANPKVEREDNPLEDNDENDPLLCSSVMQLRQKEAVSKNVFRSFLVGKSTFKDVCCLIPSIRLIKTSYGGKCDIPIEEGGTIQIKFYGKELVVGDIMQSENNKV